jgi:hypothetical protein
MAGGWQPEDYVCPRTGSTLSKADLLEAVHLQATAKWHRADLTGFTLDRLMTVDPDCCVVDFDNNPFEEDWKADISWFWRLVYSPRAFVAIDYSALMPSDQSCDLIGNVDTCGSLLYSSVDCKVISRD